MKTGIIGLPQVGKTSLFKILTKAKLEAQGYSNPREAHIGVARVPDARLDKLSEVFGESRVISGMIIIGFQVPLAGRAVVTVQADSVKIGRRSRAIDAPVRQIVEQFNRAQIPAEAVENIQAHLWGKALYNGSLNALGFIHILNQ